MDIRTLLYNLREEVSCPVCSDLFTDPRHLSCLHSFCLKCLQHWHVSSGSGNAIRCPKCQTPSRVPASGDLKDLPTSFFLNGLIDVLAIKECNTTQLTCGNCEKKSSEASYCFQCCRFCCEQCLIAHNIWRDNKDHRVLAVKEFQETDYEDFLKRPVFCSKPRHEKEELKFFCKDCKATACQTCFALQHSGHALEHAEDEAERQKAELRNVVETQRQNLQAKMNVVWLLKKSKAKLTQQGKDIKRHVQTFTDNLMAAIKARKQNIFAAVENQTKRSIENVTAETTKIENEIKVIQTSLEKAETLLPRSGNSEFLQLKPSLETIFEGIVQGDQSTAHDPESLPVVVFKPNEKLLDTVTSEEIGSLKILHQTKASQSIADGQGLTEAVAQCEAQFVLTTKDAEGRQCYSERDQVTVEVQAEPRRSLKTEVRITDHKNGQYQISYCPKDQGRYSVIIKVNGKYVHGSPFNLLVKAREQAVSSGYLSARGKNSVEQSPSSSASCYFSPDQGACSQVGSVKPFQLKPVSCFGSIGSAVGMFNHPWGVAVSYKDEIAVADSFNRRVQLFDSSGVFRRCFSRMGTNQGEFRYPRGICFDNNGNIYVADLGNNRIQIFSCEGRYIGKIGEKGSRDNQLSNPLGLSLDANGNIIVADSGNKLIKIFTTDGQFVRKIGGPVCFGDPVHCVQFDEYFIASDQGEHCIKVFSGEGKFQFKFGQKGEGDGEFNGPRCLLVTQSKQLMVCDLGNDRLQVFELNGRFVGKFGTKGDKLGQFEDPTSVAVLSNGRIVVSEYSNHRIQIFELKQ